MSIFKYHNTQIDPSIIYENVTNVLAFYLLEKLYKNGHDSNINYKKIAELACQYNRPRYLDLIRRFPNHPEILGVHRYDKPKDARAKSLMKIAEDYKSHKALAKLVSYHDIPEDLWNEPDETFVAPEPVVQLTYQEREYQARRSLYQNRHYAYSFKGYRLGHIGR